MKIVLFADSYLPYLSGVSQSVHRFATGLVQCGAQVLVIAPHYAKNEDAQMPYGVFRVPSAYLGGYPNFRFSWPFGKKVFQKIREFNPDILHSHSPFQMGLAGLKISRALQKPLVLTHHTLFLDYVHFAPWGLRSLGKILLRLYLRWFDNCCQLVIAPTAQIKAYLSSEHIHKPIEILPTGVWGHPHPRDIDVRKEYQIPKEAFLLLYVGRLSREKNIPFLLNAIGELCQKHSSLYFILVAGGPLRAAYEQWVYQRDLSQQIIFAGEHPQEVLGSFYGQSNLFVCASKTETQGLVFAEAGLYGLPSVALGYQGVLNVVEDGINGFISSENKLEFQHRVLELMGDSKQLHRLRHSTQQFAKERFDQLKLSRHLMDLYRKMGGLQ